ncbi:MAG: phosphoenolpyruvate carboxykinase (GTP) [Firmicutes bacterium]|jgi:phosphoenolpyruvate carboxykinase (GTP)|nr:phosphoenolpyruvate carboxykinase (GTP) [Bacillota bacterium]
MENKMLQNWVQEMAQLCKPEQIVWIDGSREQKEALEREAVASGELIRLDQRKWPGCFYHRTAVNDVARTENLTYICTRREEDAGPTNNWMDPQEAYRQAGEYFNGAMRGRTMYVVPFSMGPIGSPFSKIGVELTDSIYVVLNMLIVTRAGREVLAALGPDGDFTRCLHSKADLDINKRLILHFPEDNTIWSVGSGYGGNVLLGKKCLSLRIASYLGLHEGWLAEHMLIMGVEDPSGRVDYLAAAFPSACGKTNLAMLVPPKPFRDRGYKIWTVGDDIAWIRLGEDGRLWAVNPESGLFGVAPGTNSRSNPNALATIRQNTIFTNVLLTDDGDVWWEQGEGEPPAAGIAWDGSRWKPGLADAAGNPLPGAHPNARFTAPLAQCPIVSPEWENPQGVPLSAIVFGGRRSTLVPLVFETFDWRHGVYTGATMSSELTAAQFGTLGKVRRDPMAMLPFCGYNMADYFRHWLEMGRRIPRPPRIFHVNWFRKDASGSFLWPGFGDNLRVLDWILRRSRGEAGAIETPLGYIPAPGELNLEGLDLPAGAMEQLLAVDRDLWLEELAEHRRFFEQFGSRLPSELLEENKALENRLKNYSSRSAS